MSFQYFDNLDNELAERYKQKVNLLGLECCPYKFPVEKWKDNSNEWPLLQYHDLYQYLIKSPCLFSPEAMENYKSLEAYKYFVSGWVQTICHIWLDSGFFIAKADVRSSCRINDTSYQPWISLNKQGSILTAHCNCMAGLEETCSHVAAVLYKLEAAARYGFIRQTPPDLPCQWNQNFTKKIKPSLISNIDFYSKAKKKKTNKFKHNHLESTSIDQFNFLEAIRKVNPNVVGLSLFPGMSDAFLQHSENNVPVKKLL